MRFATLILFFSFGAFAQYPDGIVTTVSRAVSVSPDEADFTVSLITTLDTTPDQVLQAFQNAGIQGVTVALLGATQSYTGLNQASGQLNYQITFTTAPPALAATSKKLDSMNAKPPNGFMFLQYSASLNAGPTAVEAAHQATLPLLIQDAQNKAHLLANASGLKLGSITAISEVPAQPAAVGLYAAVISGSFVASPGIIAGSGGQYTFSASVKFAVQ